VGDGGLYGQRLAWAMGVLMDEAEARVVTVQSEIV
jgi:hypothetical protein